MFGYRINFDEDKGDINNKSPFNQQNPKPISKFVKEIFSELTSAYTQIGTFGTRQRFKTKKLQISHSVFDSSDSDLSQCDDSPLLSSKRRNAKYKIRKLPFIFHQLDESYSPSKRRGRHYESGKIRTESSMYRSQESGTLTPCSSLGLVRRKEQRPTDVRWEEKKAQQVVKQPMS
jgi:hypothetical protein